MIERRKRLAAAAQMWRGCVGTCVCLRYVDGRLLRGSRSGGGRMRERTPGPPAAPAFAAEEGRTDWSIMSKTDPFDSTPKQESKKGPPCRPAPNRSSQGRFKTQVGPLDRSGPSIDCGLAPCGRLWAVGVPIENAQRISNSSKRYNPKPAIRHPPLRRPPSPHATTGLIPAR